MPPVTVSSLLIRQAPPWSLKSFSYSRTCLSLCPMTALQKLRDSLLPCEPRSTFPRLGIPDGTRSNDLGVCCGRATGFCTPHLTRAPCFMKGQGTGHIGSCPLPLLNPRTFSRPSSFRLMMSRSKSVRKPLVLLKTIRPVNPSH